MKNLHIEREERRMVATRLMFVEMKLEGQVEGET